VCVIEEGSFVLLVGEGYRGVVRVRRGERVSTIRGVVDLDDAVGLPYGSVIRSSLGYEFALLRPTPIDLLRERGERVTQVVYPKDAAQIIVRTGLGPGSRVGEAGVGSGFLTALLAYYVRPNGRVYGVDRRVEAINVARRNLGMLGLLDYVELSVGDVIVDGFGADNLDAVILDMGDPWNALDSVSKSLAPSGFLVVYLPTIPQVIRMLEAMRGRFVDVELMEVIVRDWKTEPSELRPTTWLNAHTGFIIIARKIIK